jgi:heme/copper-type cytochrome/quinol oxidase subunit 2
VTLADFGMGATSGLCRSVPAIVWACAVITGVVFAAMIYSIVAVHKPNCDGAATRAGKSTQILWSLIPMGIFLGIAVPAVKALLFADGYCGF